MSNSKFINTSRRFVFGSVFGFLHSRFFLNAQYLDLRQFGIVVPLSAIALVRGRLAGSARLLFVLFKLSGEAGERRTAVLVEENIISGHLGARVEAAIGVARVSAVVAARLRHVEELDRVDHVAEDFVALHVALVALSLG
jgi:hypothetical protein